MTMPEVDAAEWQKLPSGLEIWDSKEGTGDAVKPGGTVTVHYTGWLTNGTEFDTSRGSGAPRSWPLGELVPGWQKGIPGMKPGGIRRLEIPSDLGYGSRGSPPKSSRPSTASAGSSGTSAAS